MFGFSKLHIKPAAGSLNKFTYNPIHITTTDFAQLNVVYSRIMYPRESLSVDMSTFMRTELPLLRPSFGKVNVKSAAVAVPMKRLFMSSDGFFANKQLSDGAISNNRLITWGDFCNQFINTVNGYATYNGATASHNDFIIINESGDRGYLLFTDKGRRLYKILRSLGYSLPSDIDKTSNSPYTKIIKIQQLSALPILAFLNIYNDCFAPRTKQDQSNLSTYLYGIRASNNQVVLECQTLFELLSDTPIYYANSYLTSAWETSTSPLSGTQPKSLADNFNASLDTFNINADTDNPVFKSYFGIQGHERDESLFNSKQYDYLKRVTQWFKRSMISGSRAYESLKSQFGIETSSAQHDFSHILDVQSTPLNIGDVTATAETGTGNDKTLVGDYAAKAIVNGNSSFKYTAKEHCYFMIFSWISVEPFIWTGMKRDVFRIKPLDYYQPEFDGLDSQPILRSEVACIPYKDMTSTSTANDLSVFGFTNRYDDLRFDNDMITGDFSLNSRDKIARECWHFGRRDMDKLAADGYKAQSEAVLRCDGSQYDNVFADLNTDGDHFNAQYVFRITLMSPMQSFNEVAQLGVGDLTIERNGNQLA